MSPATITSGSEDEWMQQALSRYSLTRDQELRDEIAARADWLVTRGARRFADRGEPFDDLVQEARIGLLKAIDRFDPERSVPFGAYATPTIMGELRRHFRDRTWAVHVPRGAKDLLASIISARDDLASELNRSPRVSEIAARVNLPTDTVIEALEANAAYFTDSLSDAGGGKLRAADAPFDHVLDREVLASLLDRLSPRQQRIVQMRFFDEMTQSEIAQKIGTSQVHVGRLLTASVRQLRSHTTEAPDGGAGAPPLAAP
ncbi:MAG: sigma-70 family RNA polymerase sigma factor [Actinomycetota bacterium]|nr:sigma-70 family RNA polymerase sigma factor [Actinomycetota bacterium]